MVRPLRRRGRRSRAAAASPAIEPVAGDDAYNIDEDNVLNIAAAGVLALMEERKS